MSEEIEVVFTGPDDPLYIALNNRRENPAYNGVNQARMLEIFDMWFVAQQKLQAPTDPNTVTLSRECVERRLAALKELSNKDGGLMCADSDDEAELESALQERT